MAEGAWTPAFDSLWDSPKTSRLARDLKVSKYHAAGIFLRLMAWMRDNVESGDLGPVDRAAIARVVELVAERDRPSVALERGERFYTALVEAGFLSADPRGHVRGWEDGPGRLVANRRADRLRKEHDRAGHQTPTPGCSRCERLSGGQTPPRPTDRSRLSGGHNGPAATPERRYQDATSTVSGRYLDARTTPVRRTESPAPTLSGGQTPDPRTNLSTSSDLSDGHNTPPTTPVRRTETTERTDSPHTPRRGTEDAGASATRVSAELLIASMDEPWRSALAAMLDSGSVKSGLVLSCFTGSSLEERDDAWVVRVANGFSRDWVRRQYAGQIRDALSKVTGQQRRIEVELVGGPREPDVVDV